MPWHNIVNNVELFFHEYVQKCELSYIYPGHDAKLHPHRVKLYRLRCVGSGLVVVKVFA